MKFRNVSVVIAMMFALLAVSLGQATGASVRGHIHDPQQTASPAPGKELPSVLYGAAYYNEYVPAPLYPERLDKDVAMMKQAGFTVVRMGESTWSLWEPEDGQFEYAWMDRVVDAMSKAGIKVILGTPTYSIPAWMAHEHPEILADRLPSGMFGG